MKQKNKKNAFIAVLRATIFIGAVFLLAVIFESKVQAAPANVSGWGWSARQGGINGSAGVGWISLSSTNCTGLNNVVEPDPCKVNNISYGVSFDLKTREVKGTAWSQDFGWICFGTTCTGLNSTPPSGGLSASLTCRDGRDDGTSKVVDCTSPKAMIGNLSGWAKFIKSLDGQGKDRGWISLSGSTYKTYLDFNRDSRVANGSAGVLLKGWAWQSAGKFGSACAGGANKGKACAINADCPNSACLPNQLGQGWFCFGGDASYCAALNAEVLFPYVYGQGGDIFTKGSVNNSFPPPRQKYNAAYLIQLGGATTSSSVQNFLSKCNNSSDENCKAFGVQLNLPADASDPALYAFKLGRFDLRGLITDVGNGKDKYGFVLSAGDQNFTLPNALGNKVYIITPTNSPAVYTLGAKEFANSADGGAGTIIVKGDLKISGDVTYSTEPAVERKQLASAIWIVLGDVQIDKSVKNVAGTFVVIGRRAGSGNLYAAKGAACTADDTCAGSTEACIKGWCYSAAGADKICPTVDAVNDAGEVCKVQCLLKQTTGAQVGDLYDGCGKFITGDDAAVPLGSKQPLQVIGSVFARQFKLQRTFVDLVNKSPAEVFATDGRLQLNPPPGMADLAKGLPQFQRQ